MQSIRSIIIFNGGSCGDFLKAICLEQIYQQSKYTLINNNSTIQFQDSYFKNFCEEKYQKTSTDELDYTKTFPIENSHYYLDFFSELNSQLFYIDYPESAQSLITQCYIEKRKHNNIENFYNDHIGYIPQQLRHKITLSNIMTAFNAQNKKNLSLWRQQSQCRAIPMSNFFDIDLLIPTVEMVCQQSLTNIDMLRTFQKTWIDANLILYNFFKP